LQGMSLRSKEPPRVTIERATDSNVGCPPQEPVPECSETSILSTPVESDALMKDEALNHEPVHACSQHYRTGSSRVIPRYAHSGSVRWRGSRGHPACDTESRRPGR